MSAQPRNNYLMASEVYISMEMEVAALLMLYMVVLLHKNIQVLVV